MSKNTKAATTTKPKGKKVEAASIDYSKPLKNTQRENFCQEYAKDNNATQSAIRAKYSEKTAKSLGQRLLTFADVKGRLEYLQAELAEDCGLEARMITEELMKIGFGNIQDLLGSDGKTFVNLKQADPKLMAAVDSIQFTPPKKPGGTGGIKITRESKLKALADLGRRIGYFQKDNEQVGQSVVDIMAMARSIRNGNAE